MKKIYLLFTLFIATTVTFAQTTFQGNGKTSFGGQVGKGSLKISDDSANISFVFTKGTGSLNDILVLYIDSKSGGFSSTANFKDSTDDFRKAMSGYNNYTQSSALTFPVGFTPEYAIACSNSFAGLYSLANGTGIGYIASAGLSPAGTTNMSPIFSFSIKKADVGLANHMAFNFFGTYISTTAYRSDEAFGDSMTGFSAGWNPYTTTTFDAYTNSTLPVSLTGFKVSKVKNNVLINWSVAQETNIDSYQIQRSADGVDFKTIQTVAASNQSVLQHGYTVTDTKSSTGINYYRLVIKEIGRQEFSKVLTVTMGQLTPNLLINYMPGSSMINFKLTGADAGTYALSVINAAGQLIQNINLEHDGSEVTKTIPVKSRLAKGIYRVVLVNNNTRISKAFMFQ